MFERRSFAASRCRPQKTVERQVAVGVVVAVEEPAFLTPVQRIVGGVEIEHDLGWRLLAGVEEQIDEQRLDGVRIGGDAGITRRFRAAEFQPVQRALAGQRRAVAAMGGQFAGQDRHDRIVAELVVVVQVLVTQRDAGDTLHHQGLDRVFRVGGVAIVFEAGGQPAGQAEHMIGGAQEQGAGIAANRSAVERRGDGAAFDTCKVEPVRVTLCRHRGIPLLCGKSLSQKNFRRFRAPMHLIRVRYAG